MHELQLQYERTINALRKLEVTASQTASPPMSSPSIAEPAKNTTASTTKQLQPASISDEDRMGLAKSAKSVQGIISNLENDK